MTNRLNLIKWWSDLSQEKKIPAVLFIIIIASGFVINGIYKGKIKADTELIKEIRETLSQERGEKLYWRDKFYEQNQTFQEYITRDKILTDSIKTIVDSLKTK